MSKLLRGMFVVAAVLAAAGVASAQDLKQIERGMKVYMDQKCSFCHAIGGKGNAKGVLDDIGSQLTVEEIRQQLINPAGRAKKTKAERKPAMRAYPNLSKDDLEDLVAYMLSLKKK